MGRGLLCALAVLLYSLPALAAPVNYTFVSGYVDVTASRTDDPFTFLLDERLVLDGDFFEFDAMAISVSDFRITAPQSGTLPLSSAYGGFDRVVIESLMLTPGNGYSSSGTALSPTEFSLNSGPIMVDAVYSAFDSNNVNPPVSNIGLSFETNTLSSTVDTDMVMFELTGLTLGFLPGADFGESADLVVKGDVTFFGVVPEPATASLMGLGLVCLAWGRRRSRCR